MGEDADEGLEQAINIFCDAQVKLETLMRPFCEL